MSAEPASCWLRHRRRPSLPVLSFGQAFTRSGFDLRRHALSALTLGDLGWLQFLAFVVTGLLAVAFAVGLWRVLRPVGPALWCRCWSPSTGGDDRRRDLRPRPALGWPPGARRAPRAGQHGSILHTCAVRRVPVADRRRGAARPTFRRSGDRVGRSTAPPVASVAFVLTGPPWSEESASIRFAVGAVLISGGSWRCPGGHATRWPDRHWPPRPPSRRSRRCGSRSRERCRR
ncbi:DUF998 domain-containing protein [Micromonospora sp. M12]